MDATNLRDKLIGSDDQRAVSPVIGVILMVAITVILAAVIAAFVLDLGDSVGEEAQAGVNVDVDEPENEFLTSWTASGNSDVVNVTVEYDVEADSIEYDDMSDDNQINNVGSSVSWSAEDLAEDATNDASDNEDVIGTDHTDADSNDDEIEEISGTITVTAEIDGGSTTVITTESFSFEDPGLVYDTN